MHEQTIDIPADQDGFTGYFTLPPKGKGPAILLIQEIFGVNGHIRAVADQYAMDGYVVLAPDVFWRAEKGVQLGYGDNDIERGRALMQQSTLPTMAADLAAAAGALRTRPETEGRLTSIGYCMGGTLSYLLGAQGAVDAAVSYYGGGTQNLLDQAAQVACPILFHFGGADTHIPAQAVESIQNAFTKHPDATFYTYPGAGHGFNCWERASYAQNASALAHGRTLEFLASRA